MTKSNASSRFLVAAAAAVFLLSGPAEYGWSAEELPPSADEKPAEPTPKERLDRLFADLGEAATTGDAKKVAEKIAKTWLVSGSDTIDLLMERALIATHSKDYALALDLLDSVVRLKPEFAEGWNKRATVHFIRKDYGRSLADIHQTLLLEPRHFGAINGLAVILGEIDEDERSLAAYRRLLEIYPHNESALKGIKKLAATIEGREI